LFLLLACVKHDGVGDDAKTKKNKLSKKTLMPKKERKILADLKPRWQIILFIRIFFSANEYQLKNLTKILFWLPFLLKIILYAKNVRFVEISGAFPGRGIFSTPNHPLLMPICAHFGLALRQNYLQVLGSNPLLKGLFFIYLHQNMKWILIILHYLGVQKNEPLKPFRWKKRV
jgi:hypothetical protein